jgi:hypothetical protein
VDLYGATIDAAISCCSASLAIDSQTSTLLTVPAPFRGIQSRSNFNKQGSGAFDGRHEGRTGIGQEEEMRLRVTASSLNVGLFFSFLFLGDSLAPTAVAQAPGSFSSSGTMTSPRAYHTATLLLNGKVLIAGGGSSARSSAELYDPVTGTFTPTADMTTGRSGHSATLLPDGRVLIVGGEWGSGPSAELYDPSTGTFTATAVLPPGFGGQRATLLNDGKVLLSGGGMDCPNGNDGCVVINTPEIYDPATGTVTFTGGYADQTGDPYFGDGGLSLAPTVLLPDGRVLIAAEPTAELYDPSTGTFRLTGQMTRGGQPQPRFSIGGTATLLANEKVLLAGGELFEWAWLADAELYDPSTEKFTAIHNMNGSRSGHTATLLRDGTVLIAGGDHNCDFSKYNGDVLRCDADDIGTEIYDPATETFSAGANLTSYRVSHTATLLMDGRILIAGGNTDMRGFWPTDSAELYTPALLVPALVVTDVQFDRTNTFIGSSYSANVSGFNLAPDTFFDVRFISPGSNESAVALNWQRGLTVTHDVPAGIAPGAWAINGVRAHRIETDHTGSFAPVSATITVSP